MGFVAAIVAFIVGAFALAFLFSIPVAWLVMLVLGAFHASFPAVPALSFWLTWIGVFVLSLVFGDHSSAES